MGIKIRYNGTIEFGIPAEFKNASGIYKITNNKTNQIYIGRTKDFYNRYNEYKKNIYYGYCNFKFKLLMLKESDVKFKMELVELTNDIVAREEFYIKKFDCVNSGLNIIYNDQQLFDKAYKLKTRSLPIYKEYLYLLKQKKKSQIELTNINTSTDINTSIPVYEHTIGIDIDKDKNIDIDFCSLENSNLIKSFGFVIIKNSFYIRNETTDKLKKCNKKEFIKACRQKAYQQKVYQQKEVKLKKIKSEEKIQRKEIKSDKKRYIKKPSLPKLPFIEPQKELLHNDPISILKAFTEYSKHTKYINNDLYIRRSGLTEYFKINFTILSKEIKAKNITIMRRGYVYYKIQDLIINNYINEILL